MFDFVFTAIRSWDFDLIFRRISKPGDPCQDMNFHSNVFQVPIEFFLLFFFIECTKGEGEMVLDEIRRHLTYQILEFELGIRST